MRVANWSIKRATSSFPPVLQALLIFVAADPAGLRAQKPSARAAVPVDPIVTIVDAFRSHPLVGLGEPHRNEQAHRLRVALIRDERFAGVVNDIVVEFGDARYQDVIDRFVSGGQVADNALRQVWENTTQGHTVWDVPIYEAFFRAVREVNASRPRRSQLRVLLGDPPTDWDNVRGWDDVARPMADYARDRYPADLIRREVLAKGRRALIIYGDGHLWRHAGFPTLVSLLEQSAGTKLFTIGSANLADLGAVQPTAASWPAPRIAVVRDTVLGLKEFSHYFPVPPGNDELRSLRLQDQMDAIAYYGPRNTLTTSELSPALCGDPAYMKMRLGRMLWVPPGAPNLGEQLKQYCARIAPK
jgi:hypothetical protein